MGLSQKNHMNQITLAAWLVESSPISFLHPIAAPHMELVRSFPTIYTVHLFLLGHPSCLPIRDLHKDPTFHNKR